MFGLSYALMVIGCLTKGLPSIAFQGLTIIALAIYDKRWNYFYHPANLLSLLVAVLTIAGFFYIYSGFSDPWPYIGQLLNESSRRASSAGIVSYLLNILKVLGEIIKITIPWCLLLIPIFLTGKVLKIGNHTT